VLLVTRSPAIAVRTAVTVAPVTRIIRDIASEVPLGRANGLRKRSVANCDSLQTIPKEALRRRPLGRLSTDELPALDRALRFALGIRT
jgi:mRNA-degrading endonuclease toxin of MazEF toxin-antitoxin module